MSDNTCDSDFGEDGEDVDNVVKVDEDTSKINKLYDRVYRYDCLPDADKVKSVKEYQDIVAQIKLYDNTIEGYNQALISTNGTNGTNGTNKDLIKIKKSVTAKMYNANLLRFDQLKELLNKPEEFSVANLLDMLAELKQIKANISKYLDKELEVINL